MHGKKFKLLISNLDLLKALQNEECDISGSSREQVISSITERFVVSGLEVNITLSLLTS